MNTDVEVRMTADGSHTLFVKSLDESYHSAYGALGESMHVFIRNGLDWFRDHPGEINVLEVGFGTGLNALLSLQWAKSHNKRINYLGIEAYPPGSALVEKLNYPEILHMDRSLFEALHQDLNRWQKVTDQFTVKISTGKVQDISLPEDHYDIVFYDAFSPMKQPEMWTSGIFLKIAHAMAPGGILTTYSASGIVKRAMRSAGLKVKRLPGPAGKHEMLRAVRE